MSRPQRRRSSLAAASPINAAPTPPTEASQTSPSQELSDEPSPANELAPRPSSATEITEITATTGASGPGREKVDTSPEPKTRIGPYVTRTEADRVRAAYLKGWTLENQGSFTDFLREAIMSIVEMLEVQHNAGEQWQTVGGNAVKSVAQMNVEATKRRSR